MPRRTLKTENLPAAMVLGGRHFQLTDQDWSRDQDALYDAVVETTMQARALAHQLHVRPKGTDPDPCLTAHFLELVEGRRALLEKATPMTRARVMREYGQGLFRGSIDQRH